MPLLVAFHLTVLSLWQRSARATTDRMDRLRAQDSQAGLSTLEITILALGLFLLAGVAVVALTHATNTRLSKIQ